MNANIASKHPYLARATSQYEQRVGQCISRGFYEDSLLTANGTTSEKQNRQGLEVSWFDLLCKNYENNNDKINQNKYSSLPLIACRAFAACVNFDTVSVKERTRIEQRNLARRFAYEGLGVSQSEHQLRLLYFSVDNFDEQRRHKDDLRFADNALNGVYQHCK